MDRSYPYSRRLVSRARLRKRMTAVLVAGLVSATALLMMTWKPDPIAAAGPAPGLPLLALNTTADARPEQRPVRRIYPYSVVPGGVSGPAELKRVIRTDSVVAAHYASFDADKASTVVVDKPRAVHVSYRKGDKVYWTARKVMLAPGETLLSDGSNEMRARCANRISDSPQYPVEAHQPAMEELDQAVELAEGEEYALGADGLPVSMPAERGVAGLPGQRFTVYGAGSGLSSTTLAGNSATGANTLSTMGLSGSSSGMGNRLQSGGRLVAQTPIQTQPQTTTPAAAPETSGGGGSLPQADSGAVAPTPQPGTGTLLPPAEAAPPQSSPASDPQPDPTPVPGNTPAPEAETPPRPAVPVTQPGGQQSGGGNSNESTPGRPDGPAPVPAAPGPGPSTPQPEIEQPAPTEIPEPGTVWLFGSALAALLALRRRRL
ncbi:MAG: PEP-CTERM sorting domain-containing protein [Lysobacteraceae bacterium]|nr:MAG: PEP-CTERM sorting domain-containing protein [Xanthomonadaceae bacterium]